MRNILILLLIPLNFSYAAEISTNLDRVLIPNFGCRDSAKSKKNVILVDQTVEDKQSVINGLNQFMQRVSNLFNNNKEYLLNHKFIFSHIDDLGEHTSSWEVVTSNQYGIKSIDLKRKLVELNKNLNLSMSQIKNDTKKYHATMLLEQVSSYSKGLGRCDNLVIFSDLLLVDHKGNNFEKGIYSNPIALEDSLGQINLIRIPKNNMRLEEINKVEAWWNQALNGGIMFSTKYIKKNVPILTSSPKKPVNRMENIVLRKKPKNASSITNVRGQSAVYNLDHFQKNDIIKNVNVEYQAKDFVEGGHGLKIEDYDDIGDEIDFQGLSTQWSNPSPNSALANPKLKGSLEQRNINNICSDISKKLTREALEFCNIKLVEMNKSKIELTLNENGKVLNFIAITKVSSAKKYCLAGYIHNINFSSVGSEFTCRTVIE